MRQCRWWVYDTKVALNDAYQNVFKTSISRKSYHSSKLCFLIIWGNGVMFKRKLTVPWSAIVRKQ